MNERIVAQCICDVAVQGFSFRDFGVVQHLTHFDTTLAHNYVIRTLQLLSPVCKKNRADRGSVFALNVTFHNCKLAAVFNAVVTSEIKLK